MRPQVKAFLLSAFVFPGLGQLYKQDRQKGVLLLLAANLVLALVFLAGVMVFSEEYMTTVHPQVLNAGHLRVLFARMLARPLFYVPAAIFLTIWGYAAVDAALSPAPPPSEETL